MKNILIIAALFLASCTKPAIEARTETASDYITSVTFYPEYPGGRTTTGLSFVVSNTVNVKSMKLMRLNPIFIFDLKLTTGKQVIHDPIEYPNYNQARFYQFQIVLNDGSKILTEPFQVY